MNTMPTSTPYSTFTSVNSRRCLSALLIASFGVFTGCSTIKPKPLETSKMVELSKAASVSAEKDVPVIDHALTLDESIARALKYNLNQRARHIEQSLALNIWKAGNYDMLPKALASAGRSFRDTDLISRSTDSVTGLPSLANPSISSDRTSNLYDLGFSWSVVDFTLGYYNARQNANRVLIASEHRRKAMHALTRDVTIAFWRMASAQRLLGEVRTTIGTAENALAEAAKANDAGLRSPVENLRFQRQLLENIRLLSNIEKEFASARATLANLINAPLGLEFTVAEPATPANIRILDIPVERMEELALLQNADLREQFYNERIAIEEVRKTIAKLLPDLSFTYNIRHSTDSYLINDKWQQAGIVLSQNLGNLASAPARKRLADGGVALARERRVAAQMALLAQVHIARLDLASAFNQLTLSERIWTIDQSIRGHVASREAAQTESMLSKVATDTASIVSMLRRYQALAEFQASAGALQSTLGMEIDVDSVSTQPLADITVSVAAWQQAWREGELPANPGFAPAPATAAATPATAAN
jgi:outer membrane protein TolC